MIPYYEEVARQRMRDLQREAERERLVSAARANSRQGRERRVQPESSDRKGALLPGKETVQPRERNRFLKLCRHMRSLF